MASRLRGDLDWPHVPVVRGVDAGGVVTRSVFKHVEVFDGRELAPEAPGHFDV